MGAPGAVAAAGQAGARATDAGLRLLVEGIIFWLRAGLPWRDLPAEFGPWPTVANRFYRWTWAGVWDRLLAPLQADADARGGPSTWPIMTSRPGRCGCGARATRSGWPT